MHSPWSGLCCPAEWPWESHGAVRRPLDHQLTGSLRNLTEQYDEVIAKYEGLESRLISIEGLLRQVGGRLELADGQIAGSTQSVPELTRRRRSRQTSEAVGSPLEDHQCDDAFLTGHEPLACTDLTGRWPGSGQGSSPPIDQPSSPTPRIPPFPTISQEKEEIAAEHRVLEQISPAPPFSHFRDIIAARRKSLLLNSNDCYPQADVDNPNSILTPEDVDRLFDIYFTHYDSRSSTRSQLLIVAGHCTILDPAFHTPHRTMRLCTLLTMTGGSLQPQMLTYCSLFHRNSALSYPE